MALLRDEVIDSSCVEKSLHVLPVPLNVPDNVLCSAQTQHCIMTIFLQHEVVKVFSGAIFNFEPHQSKIFDVFTFDLIQFLLRVEKFQFVNLSCHYSAFIIVEQLNIIVCFSVEYKIVCH